MPLSLHTAYLNPRHLPPYLYPFHCALPALASCQPQQVEVFTTIISVSQWKGTGHGVHLRFKTHQKTYRFTEICKFPPKLHCILLYGYLFLSVCFQMACIASEGADVFTQLCRDANTVTQLQKKPSLLADLSSALAYPRHNISVLQLISVHSRIIREVPLFLCCICRASWPVSVAVQNSSTISPPSLSIHIHSK